MHRSSIEVSHYVVDSEVLGNSRSVWIQPPPTETAEAGLAIFLDGEYYLTHFRTPQVMKSLQTQQTLPPMWCAYVDARERALRWPENLCNPDFATFLCDELVPQIEAVTGCTNHRMLAGLSLTGLSAAYVALSRPAYFRRVLCQSPSFWWERGQLSTRIA